MASGKLHSAATGEAPDAWLHAGLTLIRAGEPAAALAPLGRFLTVKPGHVLARYALGAAQLRAGRPAAALASFERILESAPCHGGAAIGRGLALQALGERQAALSVFRAQTVSDPLSWRAWNSVADLTTDEGERTGAIDAAAEALVRLCREADRPRWRLAAAAEALIAARRPGDAAALCRGRTGPVSGAPMASLQLARALYHDGCFAEAYAEACRLLGALPEPAGAARPAHAFHPGNGARALTDILDILSSAGIKAFLAAGTLLGFHRNAGPLAHDRDLDIGVLREASGGPDIAGVLRTHTALFLPRQARPGDRYFGIHHKGFAIDIFVHDADETHAAFGFSDRQGDIEWRVPAFGLAQAGYGGRTWTVPADTEGYLAALYGPDWRTPDPVFASAVSSPALFGTDCHVRAYYAVMRARAALLAGDRKKAAGLLRQSPLPLPGSNPSIVLPPAAGSALEKG